MRIKCDYCIGDEKYDNMTSLLNKTFGDGAIFCPFCGRCLEKAEYNKKEKPTVVERNEVWGGEFEESHPAYAQLQFSRQSGGNSNLYGSAIKHQETISMRVSRSVKHVSEYSERYYAECLPLIEIRMSQSQFAEAITSMNMGSGVPVTLESLKGQHFPKCEEKSISERASDDLKNNLNKFADKISKGEKRINEILKKKGAILNGERKEIYNIYNMLMQDLRDNMPFLHECMIEAYDKTAQSAKADIEAFYINAVTRMGSEVMDSKRLNYAVNETGNLEIIDDNDIVDVEVYDNEK